MPAWLQYVLQIILLTIVVFVIYSLLKKYIFSKIKVNKWVIIGVAVLALLIPVILQLLGIKINSNFVYIQSGIYVVIFLWLFDTLGWGPKSAPAKVSKNKSDNTVIRAKAKPNRLKNTDMEVIDINEGKNKKKKKK